MDTTPGGRTRMMMTLGEVQIGANYDVYNVLLKWHTYTHTLASVEINPRLSPD